jgi:hypothetical protein
VQAGLLARRIVPFLWRDEFEFGDIAFSSFLAWRSVPPGMAQSTRLRNGHHHLQRIGHRSLARFEYAGLGLAKNADALTMRMRDHHHCRAVVGRSHHGVLDMSQDGTRREPIENLVLIGAARIVVTALPGRAGVSADPSAGQDTRRWPIWAREECGSSLTSSWLSRRH